MKDAKFQKHGLTMLAGVSKQAAGLIESAQPFSAGDGATHPLWHLNQLSNIDKHRTLHLAGGTIEAFNFSFPPVVNQERIDRRVSERGAFEHNTIIAEGRMFSQQPMFGTGQVKVNAEIAFDVVFDQRTPLVAEWSVIRTLRDAADRTFDCLDLISREMFGTRLALPI
jgi:hypothetical protein